MGVSIKSLEAQQIALETYFMLNCLEITSLLI